jgi:hypothetical protein
MRSDSNVREHSIASSVDARPGSFALNVLAVGRAVGSFLLVFLPLLSQPWAVEIHAPAD